MKEGKQAAEPAAGVKQEETQVEKPQDDNAAARKISKTQQKKKERKLAKKESLQEKKTLRKAAKKERNAAATEKKKQEWAQQLTSMTEQEREEHKQEVKSRKRARDQEKQQKIKKLKEAPDTAPKIVVDLDFWDKMREGEQRSLVSQLGFCIGANRKSDEPCSLHYTSFCGGVLEQTKKQFPQHTNWAVEHHTDTWHEAFKGKQDSLVYLTADAPEQIDTLERDCMYVVGGIVDRNRYPQLCYNKAQELGVRTAKLPIGEYLKLTGSRVLTVNQTVGILVKYWSCKDWEEAVTSVVPPRKADGKNEQGETKEES